MDINILKLASDTKNNKYIGNCTHSTKFKSQICGDEIEIFLIIKDNMIKDFTYQSQSCIYCNASANIASKNFKRKSKSKIKNFLKLLEQFNDKENILFPNEWKDFKKIFNKKNFARKDCITLPIEALKKIIE
ncbi:iron-sulfur cluster assembly scaffold protein [Candidatus Pelagibacter sp.]|jgi:nitrogen fixation NifU-like protein|nr:iron-sulfur cluster assembly scaffold protein [Candidatus Pelagibacter sp.]|tara:strand:+ start:525 stop:920 length:396 start_codon:yes stop_codon:yes gene_type:complete